MSILQKYVGLQKSDIPVEIKDADKENFGKDGERYLFRKLKTLTEIMLNYSGISMGGDH